MRLWISSFHSWVIFPSSLPTLWVQREDNQFHLGSHYHSMLWFPEFLSKLPPHPPDFIVSNNPGQLRILSLIMNINEEVYHSQSLDVKKKMPSHLDTLLSLRMAEIIRIQAPKFPCSISLTCCLAKERGKYVFSYSLVTQWDIKPTVNQTFNLRTERQMQADVCEFKAAAAAMKITKIKSI